MKATYLIKPLQPTLDDALQSIKENQLIPRIWKQDHTVWKSDPTEISNRMGWLTIQEQIQKEIPRLERFAEQVRQDNIEQVLLLGMGGSSLAPELFGEIFQDDAYPKLEILDSTHPDRIQEIAQEYNPISTLYIVATKSGGTVETLSLFKYFYQQAIQSIDKDMVGKHFVAITDPGSKLVQLAEMANFRELFLNDPNIGGRYSALSFFGLVPAALIGLDLHQLLIHAQTMAKICGPKQLGEDNPAVYLGAILGTAALEGKDKLTLTSSPTLEFFPNWIEQLLAESTGKDGKGILPIFEKELGPVKVYGDDRLFVDISLSGEITNTHSLKKLEDAGHPVIRIEISNQYQLGGQFFLWEMATALAGALMNIHPFNQPNVESAKVSARKMVEVYQQEGSLPEGDIKSLDPTLLELFLQNNLQKGSYLAIHAYLPPTTENTLALETLQTTIKESYQIPVTWGYGPRFLHSTGQLHKGDAGKGVFLQLIDQPVKDLAIPDQYDKDESSLGFAALIKAQALGDAAALRDLGRAVLQYQLEDPPVDDLQQLSREIKEI